MLNAWVRISFEAAYSVFVVLLFNAGFHATIPVAIPAMLGTALSILLGFRTNSSYDRWWEARKIWGTIVNDSRTWARQVTTVFALPKDSDPKHMADMQREMVYRQIAWNYVFKDTLRKIGHR